MVPAATDIAILGIPVPFLLTAIAVELTPGPNMAYLAVLSLADGRRAAYAAVAGIALGLLTIGLLAAYGLAEVVTASPAAFQVLRWSGVLYMLWLAWRTWRPPTEPKTEADQTTNRGRYFRQGLLTNLLNPKAAIFYLAILPPFLDPAKPPLTQTVALTLAYVAIATAIHAAIATGAARARPLIAAAGSTQSVRLVLALSLVAISLWIIVTTRQLPGAH